MKYWGALVLAVFLLGEMFDWFAPLDAADVPGVVHDMAPGHSRSGTGGLLFLGGGTHRGK